jgi:peroxiredoxin
VELQSRLKDLQAKGLGVAAISYDPPEILAAFSTQRGITFPLLSDAGSATITRYGILNSIPEQALGPGRDDPALKADVQKYVTAAGAPSARMVGMAFPGTFVLDRQGRVTSRYFEDFYVERNTVASMMLKLGTGAAPVSATKVSSRYLDLTTYPSDSEVAPGNRFAIAVDIVPRPRMHVYAPGAPGYRVVTLNVDDQPFLRTLPVQYPASETYFFAPLKERVPIYQKPFTLLQEVVLEGTPQAQALLRGKASVTLTGTLEYQACDDKLCYNPVSLPLTWMLSLRPIVTERPTPQR